MTVERVTTDIDPRSGEHLETPQIIGWSAPMGSEAIKMVLDAPTSGDDGRSEFFYLLLANGDLVVACYPQGDTYMSLDADLAISFDIGGK